MLEPSQSSASKTRTTLKIFSNSPQQFFALQMLFLLDQTSSTVDAALCSDKQNKNANKARAKSVFRCCLQVCSNMQKVSNLNDLVISALTHDTYEP